MSRMTRGRQKRLEPTPRRPAERGDCFAICRRVKTPRAEALRFGVWRPAPERTEGGGGPVLLANSHSCSPTCTCTRFDAAVPQPPFCELSAALVVGESGADGVSADGWATLEVVRLGASDAVSLSSFLPVTLEAGDMNAATWKRSMYLSAIVSRSSFRLSR